LAFSQDGRTLASSGGNKSLIFWDVASREPLSNPLKANADIAGLAFSAPDGNQLISWDDDGQIIRWDLNVDHWKGLACHMANRPITKLEWVQYVGDATSYKPICTI
jgi:WD40 repeat protein